jgi:hypothetical protein
VQNRPLVVMGVRDGALQRAGEAAEAAGVPLVQGEGSLPEVEEVLPLAIALRMDAPNAGQTCARIRSHARLAPVPILGVSDELNDLAFTELFVWGGDDVVSFSTSQPMTRRLRGLVSSASPKSQRLSSEKPQVVIAGLDAPWRTILGRSLYNGGFSVRFAVSVEGLVSECVDGSVAVAVISDDMDAESGAQAALAALRLRGSKLPCVLVVPPKRIAGVTAAVSARGPVSVADGFAPPENVLFLVNELLAPRGVDKRASARLLYGTAAAFRPAGRDADEIGFVYNVNAGGLYIRTLAPPDAGQEIWVELWPPRSERRVRLSGKVAWRRGFGALGSTVPAGFGVEILEGLAGDFGRWKSGYELFAKSLLGSPSLPPTS